MKGMEILKIPFILRVFSVYSVYSVVIFMGGITECTGNLSRDKGDERDVESPLHPACLLRVFGLFRGYLHRRNHGMHRELKQGERG